jgi:hypothetical protein
MKIGYTEQTEAIMAVSSAPLTPSSPASGTPLLVYGGVSVAVILAMTLFSERLIQGINKLAKTLKKGEDS